MFDRDQTRWHHLHARRDGEAELCAQAPRERKRRGNLPRSLLASVAGAGETLPDTDECACTPRCQVMPAAMTVSMMPPGLARTPTKPGTLPIRGVLRSRLRVCPFAPVSRALRRDTANLEKQATTLKCQN